MTNIKYGISSTEYSATPIGKLAHVIKKPRPLKISRIYISKRGWVDVGCFWGKLPELSLVFGESCRRHLLKTEAESWIKSRNLSAWIASSLLILLTLGKNVNYVNVLQKSKFFCLHHIIKHDKYLVCLT